VLAAHGRDCIVQGHPSGPDLDRPTFDRLVTLVAPRSPHYVVDRKAAQTLWRFDESPLLSEVARVIEVPADGPHGLWIDGDHLYCAADGNALVVLNRDTAAVVAQLPLPGVPDVVMHDPTLRHLYVAIANPASSPSSTPTGWDHPDRGDRAGSPHARSRP
jgi:hypothetical protein